MSNTDSYVSYIASVYNNLKTYIVALTNRVVVLEERIITNYGVVDVSGITMGQIIADVSNNILIDKIVTGNPFSFYSGRTTNRYPNVTPPNGSTVYLVTMNPNNNSNYDVYSLLKNGSGMWEYWGIAGNTAKVTLN